MVSLYFPDFIFQLFAQLFLFFIPIHLGVEVGLFSHPSRLIKINVSATCIQTTTINQMASYCHRLTYLNLTSCTAAVTDDNLHIILESFILLRYLILDWCVNISDAGFTKRANDVTRRREMNTNSARENVHMPNGLIYLSLAGCSKITDRTLISSQFQELRYLNLTSCIAVCRFYFKFRQGLKPNLQNFRMFITKNVKLYHGGLNLPLELHFLYFKKCSSFDKQEYHKTS